MFYSYIYIYIYIYLQHIYIYIYNIPHYYICNVLYIIYLYICMWCLMIVGNITCSTINTYLNAYHFHTYNVLYCCNNVSVSSALDFLIVGVTPLWWGFFHSSRMQLWFISIFMSRSRPRLFKVGGGSYNQPTHVGWSTHTKVNTTKICVYFLKGIQKERRV